VLNKHVSPQPLPTHRSNSPTPFAAKRVSTCFPIFHQTDIHPTPGRPRHHARTATATEKKGDALTCLCADCAGATSIVCVWEFVCACVRTSLLQARFLHKHSARNRATCTTPSLKSTSSLDSMCVHGHDHCETWQVSTLLVGQPRAHGTHDEMKMRLSLAQLALDRFELIFCNAIDSMNKQADVHQVHMCTCCVTRAHHPRNSPSAFSLLARSC
jgi:hypothetical protein